MKNRMIVLAMAGVFAGSSAAFAAAPAVSVNGFADVQWYVTKDAVDSGGNVDSAADEGQFAVPQTEVNFDTDNLFIAIGGAAGDSYSIGQAFFKYQVADGWKLKGGKFDSNLTADAGSAPDMQFTQNSLLFGNSFVNDAASAIGAAGVGVAAANGQTFHGLAVTGDLGPATLTLGYGSDLSTPSAGQPEGKNSVLLLLNAAPMEGLDLEFGMLTQDKDGSGAGSLMDINGTYKIQAFTLGLDYLSASDGDSGEFDNGYSFWAGFDFGNGFNVKARMENATIVDGDDDIKATELYASYALTENLSVALDLYSVDAGDVISDKVKANTVEFVATF